MDTSYNPTSRAVAYALAYPSEARKKPDREQDGLIGPVRAVVLESLRAWKFAWLFPGKKKVQLCSTFYNAEGNKSKVIKRDHNNPKRRWVEIYCYDTTGRKAKETIDEGSTITTRSFCYLDEENKIEILEQVIDRKHIVTRKYISTFDSQGNQVEASYSEGTTYPELKAFFRYEYNDTGLVNTIKTYDSAGFLYHRTVYSYDPGGRIKMKAAYRHDGILYDRRIFAYASHERTEERLIYKEDTSLDHRIVYHYDDRDNPIDIAAYDATSTLMGRTSYTFQFDGFGNWTEKIAQCWDEKTGKPTAKWVEYRILSYGSL